MDKRVSRELNELLKEKGFIHLPDYESYIYPTIAEVLMWLYEKHGIWILAIPTVTENFAYKIVDVQLNPERPIERPPYTDVSAEDFSSPTGAYESAIKYVLENLI